MIGASFRMLARLPMMYAATLGDARAATADFSSLRLCVYAMAPMPRPLVNKIATTLSANIMLATGQTEIYPVTMSFRPVEHPERDANYWGISSIICETAIMDDDGKLLAAGEVGEIVHRGPNVMLCYFKDPAATEAVQKYGWHHTGDLGTVDKDGQLLFLDRKKDMIKTGGENVASIRVESAILGHPAVAGVAVVGLAHPRWSEAICAFVVLQPGATCSEQELSEYCRANLGKFEVPKAIKFISALPLTGTGKIQKHVLRKQYENCFAAEGL
jgi:long-chain acyl-CoA synthetase